VFVLKPGLFNILISMAIAPQFLHRPLCPQTRLFSPPSQTDINYVRPQASNYHWFDSSRWKSPSSVKIW